MSRSGDDHVIMSQDAFDNPPDPGIVRHVLGPFDTNCYIVTPSPTIDPDCCWIVDASFEPEPLIEDVRSRGLQPEALILTHAHVDHIAGVSAVLRAFPGLPVLIHEAEAGWLNDPLLNLSAMMGTPVTASGPTRTLRHGEVLQLGINIPKSLPCAAIAFRSWRILHTPGHSPGGITLVHDASKTAIVGDTLFFDSVGRTDFPGSDPATLERSIRQMLYTLPDDTIVYPGHGRPTTIKREKHSNPFVRA